MSIAPISKIHSKSSEETEALGNKLGAQLRGGEIIELIGDVGSGKTTFVRGLAVGLGSKDHVSSPTFTVHKVYSGRIPLYHYDFYRLGDDLLIRNELAELTNNKQVVMVLEWADNVHSVLPKSHIVIEFATQSASQRTLSVKIPKGFGYISL